MGWELDFLPLEEEVKEGRAPRAHCSVCGRFARYIKGSAGWRYRGDLGDDWDVGTVVCSVHGEQDASWPE